MFTTFVTAHLIYRFLAITLLLLLIYFSNIFFLSFPVKYTDNVWPEENWDTVDLHKFYHSNSGSNSIKFYFYKFYKFQRLNIKYLYSTYSFSNLYSRKHKIFFERLWPTDWFPKVRWDWSLISWRMWIVSAEKNLQSVKLSLRKT